MKTEHILVMRFSALGDVAMLVPVVKALATQYPHVRVTVLSKKFAMAFFENLAPNVGFMEADINKEYKGLHGLNKLYRRLKAKHFTAVADMHDVLRSQYLRMRFTVDRYRVAHVDKHRAGRRRLLSGDKRQLVQQPTAFQNYADVLAALGYPIKLEFKSIFPNKTGNLRLLPVAEYQEKKKFQKWIGLAPFAAHVTKEYPLEKMEEVLQSLLRLHPNARVFLFGSGVRERKCFDDWTDRFPRCVHVSALVSDLGSELILMSHLDVMLSMDSANMHLASLTGTPVVSIWGATHPMAGFLGYNQKEENIIQTDLDCRPCSIFGNKKCHRGDYACLQNIPLERIVDRITTLINN